VAALSLAAVTAAMPRSIQRCAIKLSGLIQGVGFRPHVYRLAAESGLNGWVANTPEGAAIEAEGEPASLRRFLARLTGELPPHARIETLAVDTLPPIHYRDFTVRHSATGGSPSIFVLPDLAVCGACLREIADPADRRYRYPFTSCTHCGPRWSIVDGLPFDRERTAMAGFDLCPACRAEYENPADRRFHAQTTCCPECGPRLALWDAEGRERAVRDEALRQTAGLLRGGAIVAVKGIGGFQLLVDAGNADAVARLRRCKARPAKPLAVMCASLEQAGGLCEIAPLERDLLGSAEAPIVLLRKLPGRDRAVADNVAPDNPYLGVMLSYSPLHRLLLDDFGGPVVATSGNLGGEPICIDEREALLRLGGLVDGFLVHDRPVRRPLDDSVVRVAAGQELVLRRARGYPPTVRLPRPLPPALAVGGHLKNTVALSRDGWTALSQHLGDLDTAEARANFRATIAEMERIFGIEPNQVVCDLHPDYAASRHAGETGKPRIAVQHHYAHILSCLAEHRLDPPVLGIAFDGVGLGSDGTLWGGEFLKIYPHGFERMASLRSFPLPGGERAVREPRRAALGLLYEWLGAAALERTDLAPVAALQPAERRTLARMLDRGINAPRCSSVGRLFDAVASLLDLRQVSGFEGDAAMAVEFVAEAGDAAEGYPFALNAAPFSPPGLLVDWEPMIRALLDDVRQGRPAADSAAKFHRTLAEAALAVAQRVGMERVALSGGVFQNRLLTEMTVARLEAAGFTVYRHRRIPPNDGGLALGQLGAIDN
jgi:hydrogenase maturation protein HypF